MADGVNEEMRWVESQRSDVGTRNLLHWEGAGPEDWSGEMNR